MYICGTCGNTFEEPFIVMDDPSPEGVGLPSGHYEYPVCPHCWSDEIEEADICPSCDEWHNNSVLCDDCMAEVKAELENIRRDHKLTQDDFEEVITEIFGW